MLKLWPLGLLALLVLAPLAQAAPADGRIEATSLTLEPSTLTAMGLGLRWAQPGVPTLELQAEQISVERVGTKYVSDPLGLYQGAFSPVQERTDHTSATLRLSATEGDQVLGAKLVGQVAGTLDAATARAAQGAMLAIDENGAAANENACDAPGPTAQRCVEVFGAYEVVTDAATLDVADGKLTLLLRGPTLQISDAQGAHDYASGTRASQPGELPGDEDTWVRVIASGVTGKIAADTAASWFLVAPELTVPALSLEDAQGQLRVGSRQYNAHGDDVRASGALDVVLEPVDAATHRDLQGADPVVYADTFGAQIHGDVSAVNLAATPVLVEEPAQAAGLAAILLAAGAAIAYFWPHLSFGLASLYTRLQKPDILDNEVRNAIYDIIRLHPGISAREVHRQSQQSWGTVVYHLRQLERHHLVVSRALGRTRNYYENHGKYKGMEAQLACLQSDRARLLAKAIAAQPGITQEQLAQATGFPQPTTSYYVRKLKQAGLVAEQRDGRYARYVPVGDVARFVELSEAAPTVGANAPAGVAP